MTVEQKLQIRTYRQQGMKYSDIALHTGIRATTIRSYFSRHPEILAEGKAPTCAQCGAILPKSRFRPRRFCSDKCRYKYWSAHELQNTGRKTMQQCTCQHCGKQFVDYASRKRKYCSQPCYLADRYGQ